ncbi:MAG: hypothetical protein AB1540_06425 [Bdellovibrionota bacterium]
MTAISATMWLVSLAQVQAGELGEFYRGVRAMGMGNAFTAVSDDHDAVFYNPAGLVYTKNVEIDVLNPKFDVSADDIESIGLIRQASSSLDAPTASAMFGKHLYGGAAIYPAIHLPGFVFGYYGATSFRMTARNVAMPTIEVTSFLDNGLVTGYGFEMRGLAKRHYLRLGVNAKWLIRTGYDGVIPFADLITANAEYFRNMQKGPAAGFGGGAGFQYEIPFTKVDELVLAGAWQDIGNTRFGGRNSSDGPPPIENNMSAGMAIVHRFSSNAKKRSNVKVSGEFRHLLQENIDPILRLHAGIELQINRVSVQGGINQSSFCAGLGVDLGLVKVSAVTYGVDQQALALMDRERRYMVQLTLFSLDLGNFSRGSSRDEDRRKYPRKY